MESRSHGARTPLSEGLAIPARACDDAAYARELKAQTRAAQDEAQATGELARIERDKLKLLDQQRRTQR